MTRTCGPCMMCCRHLDFTVRGEHVPAGAWCPFADIGTGCSIYDDRPETCRSFACGWLNNAHLPKSLRPDKCKVVIAMHKEGEVREVLAHVDPSYPMAHRRKDVFAVLVGIARDGHSVAAVIGGRREVVLPSGEVIERLAVPGGTPDPTP